MGIQGLLPFLKKIHQPVNISDFKGCTVAIDAYCWLHKGAFSCAEKLAMGEKTEQYVYYCMKYVDYLLRKDLKPIMVFDGCHLKSKEEVEKARRGRRELNRKKAAQFLREGKRAEAKECLQRCVDITPQMALDLMNVCRDRGVDCIVAPYEADAQLAYLNLSGIAQLVVTEDSDLLLFGCEKVIFKMDFYGNGVLIEKSRLNEVLAIQNSFYNFEKFRLMCILSGCDYLSSLPGIGLVKACKVLKTARQQELRLLLKKLPTYLKMNLVVSEEYVKKFVQAYNTFLYQLVYDPLHRKLVPLNPYPPEVDVSELDYAGHYMDEEKAYQIALGNVDIHTHKSIAFFDPRTFQPKNATKPQHRHLLSIWHPEYRTKSSGSPCKAIQPSAATGEQQWQPPNGQARTVHLSVFRRTPKSPVKSEPVQNPGKLSQTAEKLLMSQYESELNSGGQEDQDPPEASSLLQKETVENDWLPFSRHRTKHQQHSDSDEENDQENSEAQISPKKAKKRKTPSWLLETDIEAKEVESGIEMPDVSQPEGNASKPSPGKTRNVFAVSPARKAGRFNLDVHALKVKSRYFSPTPSPREASAVATSRTFSIAASPALNTSPASSKTKTDGFTPPKNRLLSLFEKAPLRPKKETDESEDNPPKKSPKLGLHKYFHAKGSNTIELGAKPVRKDPPNSLIQVKSEPMSQLTSTSLCPQTSPNDIPCNSKSTPQSKGPTQFKSRLSAFSWSKSSSVSKQMPRPASSSSSSSSILEHFSKCSHSNLSQNLSRGESDLSETKSAENSVSLGDSEGSVSTDSGVADSDKSQSADSGGEDLMELQACSYDHYVQSLAGKGSAVEDRPSRTEDKERGLPSSESSTSECIVLREAPEVTASQTSPLSVSQVSRLSVASIDSFCLDNSPGVVDLTDADADTDSQNSQMSTASKSSSFSNPSRCRVSGLTRTGSKRDLSKLKAKPGVKKSSSKCVPGQPSITDMISKYW